MYLENGRDIVRGILILIFAIIAYWVDLTTGLILIAFMGIMILQSAFTGWCPADLLLRWRKEGEVRTHAGGDSEVGVFRGQPGILGVARNCPKASC